MSLRSRRTSAEAIFDLQERLLRRFAPRNDSKKNLRWPVVHSERTIFIIALVFFSWLSIANFTVGFSFPLFVIVAIIAVVLIVVSPYSVLFATLATMMIFELWFSQIPLQIRDLTIRLYPLDLFLFASLIAIVLRSEMQASSRLRPMWIVMLVFDAIVVGIGLLSLQRGASFDMVFSGIKHFVLYPLIVPLVTLGFRNTQHLKNLMWTFGISGMAVTLFFLFSLISGNGVWTEYAPLSTYGERFLSAPHALYAAIGVLVMTVAIANSRVPKKGIPIVDVLLLIAIAGIGFSLFRNIWVGLLMGGLTAFVFFHPIARLRTLKVFTMIVALMAVVIIGWVILRSGSLPSESPIAAIQERFETFTSENALNDPSSAWRKTLWEDATQEVIAHPVLGMGFDRELHFEFEESESVLAVRELHNDPLLLLVQFGSVGFAAFSAFVILTFRRALRKQLDPDVEWIRIASLSVMVLILTASLFASYLQINMLAIVLWVVMGMIWALPQYSTYES